MAEEDSIPLTPIPKINPVNFHTYVNKYFQTDIYGIDPADLQAIIASLNITGLASQFRWIHNKKDFRVMGNFYQNLTGKPILASIIGTATDAAQNDINIQVTDDTSIGGYHIAASAIIPNGTQQTINAIIPNGLYYAYGAAANITVNAVFETDDLTALSLYVGANGEVDIDNPILNVPASTNVDIEYPCIPGLYAVNLLATPAGGHNFTKWIVNGVDNTNNPLGVNVDNNLKIEAVFA